MSSSRDYNREYMRRWRAANPNYYSEWGQKHAGVLRERRSKYHVEHKEAENESARRYDAEHKEAARERARRTRKEKPEIHRAKNARRRALKLRAPGRGWTSADVRAQYKAQRGRCFYCKARLGDVFHQDHIMPLAKGGHHCRSNLALACPPCNLRKNSEDPQTFAGILL